MQSTTSTACPPAIAKVTTPKPRKHEIIEAAAKLEYEKRTKAFEAQQAQEQSEASVLRGRIQKFVAENVTTLLAGGSACIGSGSGSIYDHKTGRRSPFTSIYGVTFSLPHLDKLLPAGLQKALINHLNKWERGLLPDGTPFKVLERPQFLSVKSEIRALFEANAPVVASTKDERVAAILSDPKAVKALNAMLRTFQQPARPELAAPTPAVPA